VPAGAIPDPYTAAIIPGAAVKPAEKLFASPAIEMLEDAPTTSVTATLTTCGCDAADANESRAVYAPGDKPAVTPETAMVPAPLPDVGETDSQLVARFAGPTVTVQAGEPPPLKLTGMAAGATWPAASTCKIIDAPAFGVANATGAPGGGARVALTVDET
jgi:hypothetical protein